MAEEYRWSVQQINSVVQSLGNSLQNLRQMKETYEKIPQKVTEAWTSVNAEELNVMIETDIQKYEAVLKQLEEIIDGLTKAAEEYSEGENNQKSVVSRISSQMAFNSVKSVLF